MAEVLPHTQISYADSHERVSVLRADVESLCSPQPDGPNSGEGILIPQSMSNKGPPVSSLNPYPTHLLSWAQIATCAMVDIG